MHRLRVIDHGGNAFGFQGCLESISLSSILELDGVLGPTGTEAGRNDRGCNDILQTLSILFGRSIDIIELILCKRLQLNLQNRRLHSIQPGIQADADVVILKRSLSVNAIRIDQSRPLVIVRKHRAAVTIAAQRLGGEEGGGGDVAEGTSSARIEIPGQAGNDGVVMADLIGHLNGTSESLRPVFQDQEPIAVSYGPDSLIISRETEQINGNDNARTQASFCEDFLHSTL